MDNISHVYIVKFGNLYKIGRSNNPKKRISSFSGVTLPHKFELIHTFDTSNAHLLERGLHKKFHKKRVQGEWFKLSKNDIEYLKNKSDFLERLSEEANVKCIFDILAEPIPNILKRAWYRILRIYEKIYFQIFYAKDFR